ncbi:MBL fold metallo-hydrolase [uncultured Ruthenibacterium sp.]|uniref:MBL fold metallo-hydrolase n=1 Tax=uncultured Ruthenibacterium sp. TaxID=1905347 RepID=UPI00349E7722
MARFTTLYSGSSGNCAFIEENGRFLLVDMGKSCRSTLTALKTLDVSPRDLLGILVTHEHSDHVGGLNVFLKKYPVPVYSSAATLDVLEERGIIPAGVSAIAVDGREEELDGFSIQSFSTSHDSVDCCGYRIVTPEGKVVSIATDLGFISDEVMANLYFADLVALESNYDLNMLMTGHYPYYLKMRISSERGHLSNEECARTILRLMQSGCKNFSLCHISQENNTPELALATVQCMLATNGYIPDSQTRVQAARRHEISPLFEF